MYSFEFLVEGLGGSIWIVENYNDVDAALRQLKQKLLSQGITNDVKFEVLQVLGPWYVGG